MVLQLIHSFKVLAMDPEILLMDEPFAALDAITREELQREFLNLCKTQGTAALFVTHDMNEAIYLADEISLMHQGACHLNWSKVTCASLKEPGI